MELRNGSLLYDEVVGASLSAGGGVSPFNLLQSMFPGDGHSRQPCPHPPHLKHWIGFFPSLNGPWLVVSGPLDLGGLPPLLGCFFKGEFGALALFGFTLLAFRVAAKLSIWLFNSWSFETLVFSTTPTDFLLADTPLLSENSNSASLAISNNSSYVVLAFLYTYRVAIFLSTAHPHINLEKQLLTSYTDFLASQHIAEPLLTSPVLTGKNHAVIDQWI